MRTDTDRINQYGAKYEAATVSLKVAAMLPGMKTGYAALANDLQPVEAQVTSVLTTDNVVSAQWGQYYAFAREIWKRAKLGGDPALTTDAQLILNKWEAYGAADTVMIHIALDVFGLTLT